MTTTVGKARIEIEVDGSGITKSLEDAMDRALDAVARSSGVAFSALERDAASAGDGMGACLVMAEQMGAYILTDKATFLTFVANDGIMG